MADAYPGLVKGVSTTSGTGTYTVMATSDAPYRSLAQAVADGSLSSGDIVQYVARDTTTLNDADFEAGEGTFTVAAGPTYQISRNIIRDGSNGPGTPISWGVSGQRDVYLTGLHGSETARLDRANTFTQDQAITHGANPKLSISEDLAYPFELTDSSSAVCRLKKTGISPEAILRLEVTPSDGVGASRIQFYRETSTSGDRNITVYAGDGTNNPKLNIDAATGDVDTEGGLDVAKGVVLNSEQGNNDVRMKSTSQAGAFFLDASANRLGLGTDTPTSGLDVVFASNFRSSATFRTGATFNADAGSVGVAILAQTSGTALDVDVVNKRLGVGVANPTVELHVKGSISTTSVIGQSSIQGVITSYSTATEIGNISVKSGPAVTSKLQLEPIPDSSSQAHIELFRNTNTSGTRVFNIFAGNGTGTNTVAINAATGDIIALGTVSANAASGFGSGAELEVAGSLAIMDSVTAPTTASGWAFIYVDSADGDLKVKFGDGTVKVLAADT